MKSRKTIRSRAPSYTVRTTPRRRRPMRPPTPLSPLSEGIAAVGAQIILFVTALAFSRHLSIGLNLPAWPTFALIMTAISATYIAAVRRRAAVFAIVQGWAACLYLGRLLLDS